MTGICMAIFMTFRILHDYITAVCRLAPTFHTLKYSGALGRVVWGDTVITVVVKTVAVKTC